MLGYLIQASSEYFIKILRWYSLEAFRGETPSWWAHYSTFFGLWKNSPSAALLSRPQLLLIQAHYERPCQTLLKSIYTVSVLLLSLNAPEAPAKQSAVGWHNYQWTHANCHISNFFSKGPKVFFFFFFFFLRNKRTHSFLCKFPQMWAGKWCLHQLIVKSIWAPNGII